MIELPQNCNAVFETNNAYMVYKLYCIARWGNEHSQPIRIGCALKTLGFSLHDWFDATGKSVDLSILSFCWERFLEKDRVEAFNFLNAYINQYFDEAERNMARFMEKEESYGNMSHFF